MGSESIGPVAVSQSSLSSREKSFPPGFRFHPTDEELILYYLKRKICSRSLKLDIIGQVDVYKWDPEELPGQSKWNTGDRQWFFFTPRDRKYPNGGRSNRATMHGYWKATGKDRIIKCNSRSVGIKKTLVYYQGRAACGQRTDWVMHEYTLNEEELKRCKYAPESYALYKVFKKSGAGPKNGEQYGAPFVEEEWPDDVDYLDVDALMVQTIDTLVEPKLKSGVRVEPEVVPPVAQIDLVNDELVDKATTVGNGEELQSLVGYEDFLELDDLISPQPAFQNSELLVQDNLQFDDFDRFCAFDFYNDSTRFNEMNPFECQQIQEPCYTSNLDYGIESSGLDSYLNVIRSEATNTEFLSTNGTMAAQATDATSSAPSGVITDEKSGKPDSGVNQQKTREGIDTDSCSWFSSALWAFVESVPTSPAFASESSALVNKAIGRMPLATRRVERSSRSLRGIVYFSCLGVLLAILCVFVGTSFELLGRCIL